MDSYRGDVYTNPQYKDVMLNQSYIRQRIHRKSPLVLVVDDNEDNIIYACGSLKLFEYKHLVATNARTAFDIAVDKLPDLILLDVVMPRMSGIELAQRLKRNPLTNHIPIVAVTGLAYAHQKQQIMDAGCDDYIVKPYLIEKLEKKLFDFLNFNISNLYSNN